MKICLNQIPPDIFISKVQHRSGLHLQAVLSPPECFFELGSPGNIDNEVGRGVYGESQV